MKGPGADRPHPGMRITTSAAAVFAAALGALIPAHAASPGTATCFNRIRRAGAGRGDSAGRRAKA
jgi:hypothetical protein